MRYVDAREFAYWQAYSRLEPYGPRADDRRIGTLAATFVNVFLDKKKQHKPYTWLDFFPEYRPRRYQTQEEMLQMVELLNTAFGGKDLRAQKG